MSGYKLKTKSGAKKRFKLTATGKVKAGVGCVYISRLEDVDQAVLRDLCGRAVRAVEAGSD